MAIGDQRTVCCGLVQSHMMIAGNIAVMADLMRLNAKKMNTKPGHAQHTGCTSDQQAAINCLSVGPLHPLAVFIGAVGLVPLRRPDDCQFACKRV